MIQLFNEDCLVGMRRIDNDSIDCIICDLPYGVLASDWDKILNFETLWNEYLRITKPDAAICLFSSGLFTQKLLRCSPENLFRYKWVWVKNTVTNFIQANNRPMSKHEDILIFSKGTTANGSKKLMKYFPQNVKKIENGRKIRNRQTGTVLHTTKSGFLQGSQKFTGFPNDILFFDAVHTQKKFHTSQKPVPLLEYLIKTYTNQGDIVLDNCMGSGSTAIACITTGRNFIGFETDSIYFNIAKNRVDNQNLLLFNGV